MQFVFLQNELENCSPLNKYEVPLPYFHEKFLYFTISIAKKVTSVGMAKNPFLVYCANSIVPHKSNYSRATASDLLLATLRGVLFLKDLAKKLPFQNTEALIVHFSKMSYFGKCTLYFATFLRSCTWVPTLQIITADARGDDYCIGKLLSRAFTKWKKGHKSSNSSLLFSRRRDICWHSPNFKTRKKIREQS